MKKNIKKSILAYLTFVILCIEIFGMPAYAISTSCLENHFEMLQYDDDGDGLYIGDEIRTPPSKNTCPYVAMSLILTYYDTYWHDDFVPDEFQCSDGEEISLDWQDGEYSSSEDKLIETFSAIPEAT